MDAYEKNVNFGTIYVKKCWKVLQKSPQIFRIFLVVLFDFWKFLKITSTHHNEVNLILNKRYLSLEIFKVMFKVLW